MVQQAVIRARQVKALYQRELTSLNRNRHLDEATRKVHADRLWSQANDQIARLRQSVGPRLDELPDEQRVAFDPPKRPPFRDQQE